MPRFARARIPILVLLILGAPAPAYADLVNINTADVALLDTLPGIGPTKAQAIVDYRNANGPFAQVADIQNVSGIGPSTYAQIEPFITVGGTSAAPASSGTATSTSVGTASTYVPPPSALSVDAGSDRTVLLNVAHRFTAEAFTKSGVPDGSARIFWSFGDGSSGEGSAVEKMYRYPGTYLVTATAEDGSTSAYADFAVTVVSARVRVAAVTDAGITLSNDADERLDLSGWRLLSGTGTFRLPLGAALSPRSSVLFPYTITNLPIAPDATLSYPDGLLAARYAPPTAALALSIVQPAFTETSSSLVQGSDQVITSPVSIAHDDTEVVGAPAGAAEAAPAGAALPGPAPERSWWMYGLISIALIAGGAFVLL